MRTPRMRHLCSPCSRATAQTRPRPWRRSQPPAWGIGGPNTSLGWIEGNFPRTGPRPGASPEWPSRSPSSTASYTSAPHPASYSGASLSQGRELIRDIHAGVCGHHAVPRTLVGNAFRQGFYWPTVIADANEVVRTCEGCQFYACKTNLPAHAIQTIPVTWPFAVWGLVSHPFSEENRMHLIRVP
jgi:hypothetical protein